MLDVADELPTLLRWTSRSCSRGLAGSGLSGNCVENNNVAESETLPCIWPAESAALH